MKFCLFCKVSYPHAMTPDPHASPPLPFRWLILMPWRWGRRIQWAVLIVFLLLNVASVALFYRTQNLREASGRIASGMSR